MPSPKPRPKPELARRRPSAAVAEKREVEQMLARIQHQLDDLHAKADDLLRDLTPGRGA